MEDILNFKEITAWDNYKAVSLTTGDIVIQSEVTEKALNPYGSAHGGYLFTLCDALAGRVAASAGSLCVTLQSSINYLKEARLHDILTIHGTLEHNGKSTKVVNVEIRNQKEEKICAAVFTMYVVSPLADLEKMREERK